MTEMAGVIALVLAGGEGSRLRPLTDHESKPALPFVGGYRIVDFVLANLVNSNVRTIYVLAQYRPGSLIQHIDAVWREQSLAVGRTINVVLPPRTPFQGTAAAVAGHWHLIERHRPDAVAIFAADHIYRMDVRQMVEFHRARGADLTIAAVRVPVQSACSLGVIAVDDDGWIEDFEEKPLHPRPVPGDATHAYASMGNYVFRPAALQALIAPARDFGGLDFGRHVLPSLCRSGYRAQAYDFATNYVPGLRPVEYAAYWRDVGTLDALAAARRDAEGHWPRLDLGNRAWPIRKDLLDPDRQSRLSGSRVERAANPQPLPDDAFLHHDDGAVLQHHRLAILHVQRPAPRIEHAHASVGVDDHH